MHPELQSRIADERSRDTERHLETTHATAEPASVSSEVVILHELRIEEALRAA